MLTFGPIYSQHLQLADLGIALAFDLTNMAMTSAFNAASLAFSLPFALAVPAARSRRNGMPDADAPATVAAKVDAYSAYRSDGGHATTLVLMGG